MYVGRERWRERERERGGGDPKIKGVRYRDFAVLNKNITDRWVDIDALSLCSSRDMITYVHSWRFHKSVQTKGGEHTFCPLAQLLVETQPSIMFLLSVTAAFSDPFSIGRCF